MPRALEEIEFGGNISIQVRKSGEVIYINCDLSA